MLIIFYHYSCFLFLSTAIQHVYNDNFRYYFITNFVVNMNIIVKIDIFIYQSNYWLIKISFEGLLNFGLTVCRDVSNGLNVEKMGEIYWVKREELLLLREVCV